MKSSSKQLVRGTSFYTLSKLLTKVGLFLLLPLFTRYITPEEYGVIELLRPIINFIPLFFTFGLYTAQTRYYFEIREKEKIKEYIFTLNSFLWVVTIIILFFLHSPLKFILGKIIDYNKVNFYPYIFLALIAGFVKLYVHMARNYFKVIKKYSRVAIGNIIGFIAFAVISITLIVYLDYGVLGYMVAFLCYQSLLLYIFYFKYIKNTKWSFNKERLRQSLAIGLPISLSSITGVILGYSDRIVLSNFLAMEVVGTYSLAYNGGLILTVLISSFNSTWLPIFNELMGSERDNKYKIVKERLTQFVLFIVFICLIGQMLGKEVITLIFPAEYNPTIQYLPFVLFAIVFTGINHYLKNILIYHEDTLYFPLFAIVSAVINLGINIIFIPKFGPLVAAISTIISYLLITIIYISFIKFKYKNYDFEYIKIIFILFFSMNPLLILLLKREIGIYTFLFKLTYLIIFIMIFRESIINFIQLLLKSNRGD